MYVSTQLAVFPRMSTSVEVPADALASIKRRLSALNSSEFSFRCAFTVALWLLALLPQTLRQQDFARRSISTTLEVARSVKV